MPRLCIALLIVLVAFPGFGIGESVAADGKPSWKPRGRCVEVSNRKRRIRINCDSRKVVEIETGVFPFGVSLDEAIADAVVPERPRQRNGNEDTPDSETPLTVTELVAAYDTTGDDDVDCEDDFGGDHDLAQEAYEANTNDPFGLDGPIGPDNDTRGTPDLACEGLL